jgi:hypothetical protein
MTTPFNQWRQFNPTNPKPLAALPKSPPNRSLDSIRINHDQHVPNHVKLINQGLFLNPTTITTMSDCINFPNNTSFDFGPHKLPHISIYGQIPTLNFTRLLKHIEPLRLDTQVTPVRFSNLKNKIQKLILEPNPPLHSSTLSTIPILDINNILNTDGLCLDKGSISPHTLTSLKQSGFYINIHNVNPDLNPELDPFEELKMVPIHDEFDINSDIHDYYYTPSNQNTNPPNIDPQFCQPGRHTRLHHCSVIIPLQTTHIAPTFTPKIKREFESLTLRLLKPLVNNPNFNPLPHFPHPIDVISTHLTEIIMFDAFRYSKLGFCYEKVIDVGLYLNHIYDSYQFESKNNNTISPLILFDRLIDWDSEDYGDNINLISNIECYFDQSSLSNPPNSLPNFTLPSHNNHHLAGRNDVSSQNSIIEICKPFQLAPPLLNSPHFVKSLMELVFKNLDNCIAERTRECLQLDYIVDVDFIQNLHHVVKTKVAQIKNIIASPVSNSFSSTPPIHFDHSLCHVVQNENEEIFTNSTRLSCLYHISDPLYSLSTLSRINLYEVIIGSQIIKNSPYFIKLLNDYFRNQLSKLPQLLPFSQSPFPSFFPQARPAIPRIDDRSINQFIEWYQFNRSIISLDPDCDPKKSIPFFSVPLSTHPPAIKPIPSVLIQQNKSYSTPSGKSNPGKTFNLSEKKINFLDVMFADHFQLQISIKLTLQPKLPFRSHSLKANRYNSDPANAEMKCSLFSEIIPIDLSYETAWSALVVDPYPAFSSTTKKSTGRKQFISLLDNYDPPYAAQNKPKTTSKLKNSKPNNDFAICSTTLSNVIHSFGDVVQKGERFLNSSDSLVFLSQSKLRPIAMTIPSIVFQNDFSQFEPDGICDVKKQATNNEPNDDTFRQEFHPKSPQNTTIPLKIPSIYDYSTPATLKLAKQPSIQSKLFLFGPNSSLSFSDLGRLLSFKQYIDNNGGGLLSNTFSSFHFVSHLFRNDYFPDLLNYSSSSPIATESFKASTVVDETVYYDDYPINRRFNPNNINGVNVKQEESLQTGIDLVNTTNSPCSMHGLHNISSLIIINPAGDIDTIQTMRALSNKLHFGLDTFHFCTFHLNSRNRPVYKHIHIPNKVFVPLTDDLNNVQMLDFPFRSELNNKHHLGDTYRSNWGNIHDSYRKAKYYTVKLLKVILSQQEELQNYEPFPQPCPFPSHIASPSDQYQSLIPPLGTSQVWDISIASPDLNGVLLMLKAVLPICVELNFFPQSPHDITQRINSLVHSITLSSRAGHDVASSLLQLFQLELISAVFGVIFYSDWGKLEHLNNQNSNNRHLRNTQNCFSHLYSDHPTTTCPNNNQCLLVAPLVIIDLTTQNDPNSNPNDQNYKSTPSPTQCTLCSLQLLPQKAIKPTETPSDRKIRRLETLANRLSFKPLCHCTLDKLTHSMHASLLPIEQLFAMKDGISGLLSAKNVHFSANLYPIPLLNPQQAQQQLYITYISHFWRSNIQSLPNQSQLEQHSNIMAEFGTKSQHDINQDNLAMLHYIITTYGLYSTSKICSFFQNICCCNCFEQYNQNSFEDLSTIDSCFVIEKLLDYVRISDDDLFVDMYNNEHPIGHEKSKDIGNFISRLATCAFRYKNIHLFFISPSYQPVHNKNYSNNGDGTKAGHDKGYISPFYQLYSQLQTVLLKCLTHHYPIKINTYFVNIDQIIPKIVSILVQDGYGIRTSPNGTPQPNQDFITSCFTQYQLDNQRQERLFPQKQSLYGHLTQRKNRRHCCFNPNGFISYKSTQQLLQSQSILCLDSISNYQSPGNHPFFNPTIFLRANQPLIKMVHFVKKFKCCYESVSGKNLLILLGDGDENCNDDNFGDNGEGTVVDDVD